MSGLNLVVVTGGTGHVGSMVIDELLKGGYTVRATARPGKVKRLKDTYPNANDKLEIVEMIDILADAGKWPEILQGADAVIHVACPLYQPGVTSEEIYDGANRGTQKLLDAVGKSSVKRFVITGSTGVFFKPDFSSIMDKVVYDHNTWAEIEDMDPKERERRMYGRLVRRKRRLRRKSPSRSTLSFTVRDIVHDTLDRERCASSFRIPPAVNDTGSPSRPALSFTVGSIVHETLDREGYRITFTTLTILQASAVCEVHLSH
ncbi:hypothetical protein C8R46DRAFT_443093 [Mycena filopes]|nr:hypothetical protein C8R46DRAFT_443093 [Mycena filopes]